MLCIEWGLLLKKSKPEGSACKQKLERPSVSQRERQQIKLAGVCCIDYRYSTGIAPGKLTSNDNYTTAYFLQ